MVDEVLFLKELLVADLSLRPLDVGGCERKGREEEGKEKERDEKGEKGFDVSVHESWKLAYLKV